MVFAGALAAQPTSNPVATQYANDYPVWTDSINWENVIDMSAYTNGANHFERFENARDELHAQGGGVLYYPAGTYHFDLPDVGFGPGIGPLGRGLMLKSGVVIRGADTLPGQDQAVVRASEDPANPLFANDVTHNLAPQTVFTFPMQMRGVDPVSLNPNSAGELPSDWNLIGITPGIGETTVADVRNVGVVNVKLDGGIIYWGYHTPRPATMNEGRWFNNVFKTGWPLFAPPEATWGGHTPNGEHYMHAIHGSEGWHSDVSAGSGRLAMNVKIQDGAPFNDMFYPDRRAPGSTNMSEDTFSHYRFTGRLTAHGGDIFIANNVLAKPTKNFVYREIQNAGMRNVLFDYANHIGIDVNKSNYGGNQDNPTVFTPGSGYYAENVIVRDNWVFNRGNKNFEISGMWAQAINNHAEKYYIGNVIYAGYITNPQVFGFDPSSPDFDPMATLNLGGHTFDGWNWRTGTNSSDYMNRGFDFGGRNLWVHRNSVVNPGSIGNDGEGFIGQEHNRVGVYSWAWSDNQSGRISKGPGTIGEGDGKGWIGPYNMQQFGILMLRNGTQNVSSVGTIASDRSGSPDTTLNYLLDAAIIGTTLNGRSTDGIENLEPGHPNFDRHLGPEEPVDIIIIDDVTEHSAPVNAPVDVNAQLLEDGSVFVSWTDTADNEVGFRVERRVAEGTWHVIAYRPRSNLLATLTDVQDPLDMNRARTQSLVETPIMIAELNPQAWRDYTAPTNSGETIEYRVIAINAMDDDSTGISAIAAVGEGPGPITPEIPRAVHVSMIGGSVELSFASQAGVAYQLQRSHDLVSWEDVGMPISGDGSDLVAQDDEPGAVDGIVFYRLEIVVE
ncbi:MAG: hypothetical protein JJT96_02355 [Opitutales bacterium]|nr:hypothetical protein [Opitutales bacterium]